MSYLEKIGMYFFVIGSLLSLLAGSFNISNEMKPFLFIVIIFLGVFSAIINISENEEKKFLIAGMSLVSVIILFKILDVNPFISFLSNFFDYVGLFVGVMLLTISLKLIAEYAHSPELMPIEDADEITKNMDKYLLSKKEEIWNFIVFLAVAVTFIYLLLEIFFNFPYALSFFLLDAIITIIFFIDLIVLYNKENNFKSFLRNCWVDIIATIPFYGLLRVFKIVRIMRIVKLIKLNKTLKFFSKESGVKHYLRKKNS